MPAARKSDIPVVTPQPTATTPTAGRRPAPPLLLVVGAVILVVVGIGLGVILSKGPRQPPAAASVGAPVSASSALTNEQAIAPPTARPDAAALPLPETSLNPHELRPVILNGRVNTSVRYDAAQNPSLTAVLFAHYGGAGPQGQIVASLWRGRAKVGDCAGGTPAQLPAGLYRCEWDNLPPGSYEFQVGFAGQRPSVFRFANTSRAGPPPPSAPPVDLTAESAPPPPDIITQPHWIRLPNGDDISRFYPSEAMMRRVEGSTRITCNVSVTGQLVGCVVQSETPSGYGFGAAAIRLASTLRMRPMLRNGQPVGDGVVTIPIRWQLQ